MPVEPHNHGGMNSPRVNINDIIGPKVVVADAVSGVSASRSIQPTIMQRGFYTLVDGTTNLSASLFVPFPQSYSETTTLHVFLTPTLNVTHSVNGLVTSGFTVSGTSATQTGHWLSIGYK